MKKAGRECFRGRKIENIIFTESVPGISLNGVTIKNCYFNDVDFSGANFSHAKILDSDFSDSDFSGVNFNKAEIVNTNLMGTNLSGANLSGATLTGTVLDLSRYGLPQTLFDGNGGNETLVTLTNRKNLAFFDCLYRKITEPGELKYKKDPRLGAVTLHSSLKSMYSVGNKESRKKRKEKNTQSSVVLNNRRFMRDIMKYLDPPKDITHLLESLPSLYVDNYERVTEENLEDLCNEVVGTKLAHGRGIRRRRKTRNKI